MIKHSLKHTKILLISLALLSTSIAGCLEPDPINNNGPINPDTLDLRGPCTDENRSGRFIVEVQENYSVVDGQITDGVVPLTIPEVLRDEGNCKLLKQRNPFCDPPCESGQTCDFSSQCIAFPRAQDVGTIKVRGLSDPVEMTARSPGNHYFDTSLPHPAFEPNSGILLTAPGGPYDPFELAGIGVDPLISDNMVWLVKRGTPINLTWQAPESHSRATIEVRMTIDQHGASPASIECTFEDTGQAEIPVTFVDALLDAEISGYPNGALTRRTADSQTYTDGCVELEVSSPLRASVRVDGHVPCSSPTDCPQGMTCNTAINTCE